MNHFLIATSLLAIAAGCSDEADIGIDSTPITCGQTATATVAGDFSYQGYSFGDNVHPTALASPTSTSSVMLSGGVDNTLQLQFSFVCGAAEQASYGVLGNVPTDQNVCPLKVRGVVYGPNQQALPAAEGTLIVDESSNCLAGRFRVDFGDNGAIGGTFSAPWQ